MKGPNMSTPEAPIVRVCAHIRREELPPAGVLVLTIEPNGPVLVSERYQRITLNVCPFCAGRFAAELMRGGTPSEPGGSLNPYGDL